MSWREDVVRDLESGRIMQQDTHNALLVRHLSEKVRSQQAAIDRLESELEKQKKLNNAIVNDYETLRNALKLRFDELDEIIEKLWFAPGGPVAASLIVQYDHHNK